MTQKFCLFNTDVSFQNYFDLQLVSFVGVALPTCERPTAFISSRSLRPNEIIYFKC